MPNSTTLSKELEQVLVLRVAALHGEGGIRRSVLERERGIVMMPPGVPGVTAESGRVAGGFCRPRLRAPAVAARGLPVMATRCWPCSTRLAVRAAASAGRHPDTTLRQAAEARLRDRGAAFTLQLLVADPPAE
jgi:hypothetical protein